MDLLEIIKGQYESLNKTRRKISDFLLGDPAKCCFLSLKEFAAAVDVTEVTVLNYCRGLGLGSYIELKKELQTHMLTRFSPGDRVKLAVSGSGSISSLYAQVAKAERDALRDTFERVSLDEVVAFIEQIRQAKRVFVVAHDASCIASHYFVRRMLPLGLDVCELDLQDRHEAFYRLVAEAPEHCLLIPITVPPYGRSTMAITRYCQSLGMNIAAITDRHNSPAARCAGVSLICHTEFMGLTNSYTAMMSMINVLAMLYSFVEEDQDPARKAELSRMATEFDQYVPEYPEFSHDF